MRIFVFDSRVNKNNKQKGQSRVNSAKKFQFEILHEWSDTDCFQLQYNAVQCTHIYTRVQRDGKICPKTSTIHMFSFDSYKKVFLQHKHRTETEKGFQKGVKFSAMKISLLEQSSSLFP